MLPLAWLSNWQFFFARGDQNYEIKRKKQNETDDLLRLFGFLFGGDCSRAN